MTFKHINNLLVNSGQQEIHVYEVLIEYTWWEKLMIHYTTV